MAAHSGSKLVRDGLDFSLDTEAKRGPSGLTYWLFSWNGGHPTTQAGMDTVFTGTGSSTFIKTGFHEGTLNWANGPTVWRFPNSNTNNVTGTTTGYPSYMDRSSYYGIIYKGWIYAPKDGLYEFSIDGDDAMDIIVNDTVVAWWYGGHGFRVDPARNDGSITLTKGWHSFQARFEEQGGGDGIAIGWKRPNGQWELIPSRYLQPLVQNTAPVKSNTRVPKFRGVSQAVLRKNIPGRSKKQAVVDISASLNNTINTGYTRGDLGDQFTISAFFKYNGTSGETYRAIIGGDDPTGGTEFFIGKNAGNNDIGIQDGNYRSNMVSSSVINAFDGQWHEITYSYNNGTGKCYVDGKLRATNSFTKCNSAEQIMIGTEVEGGIHTWNGEIAKTKIYTRVLSDREVRMNFLASRRRFNIS